ncbi:MAG: diacylglycerol kinase, partial [Cohaesibacteraceae bacterium]|nr:diacylglycerol kinase [Cohaesibacteraceae bacterium]
KRETARVANRAVLTWEGIKITWVDEASFSQWVVANIVSAALTFTLEMSPVERALIIGFGLLVLVMELMNTAVETAIDRISEDIHPLSKKAKDVACAAVTMTAIATGVIWAIIALPKLL